MARPVDNNPKTRVGNDKVPLHLLPFTASVEQSLAHSDGGYKYQPMNWHVDRISVSVYMGGIDRHLSRYKSGENRAADSGVHHLGAVMANCAMLIDAEVRGMLNDNRSKCVEEYAALMDAAEKVLGFQKARDVTKFDLHDIAGLNTPAAEPAVEVDPREGSGLRIAHDSHHCYKRNKEALIDDGADPWVLSTKPCALDTGKGEDGYCTLCTAYVEPVE